MPDPHPLSYEAAAQGGEPSDALLALLERSEQWIRARTMESRIEIERLKTSVADLTALLATRNAMLAQVAAERDSLHALLAGKDTEMTQHAAHNAHLTAALATQNATLAQMSAERDGLRAALAGKDGEIAQQAARNADLASALATLDAALAQVSAERDALDEVFASKEAYIKQLQNSLSWRVTWPLRQALWTVRGAIGRRAPRSTD